jgi:hypothetical protein
MSDHPAEDRPDVESIIREIRQAAVAAGATAPESDELGAAVHDGLYEQLAAANRACGVGFAQGRGLHGLARRGVLRLLGSTLAEINGFHAAVVRVLNRLVAVLDGRDVAAGGELLAGARRRNDVVTHICERMAAYDDLGLADRLKQVEERLAQLEERAG